jgi:predicted nucleic acid-binding protein
MILYLDTSALVKRYIMESGSKDVNELVEQADITGSVLLTRIEMASAFAKASRMNWVEPQNAENAWQDFLSDWPSFARLLVTPVLVERAAYLAWTNGLRGYDAIHLAAALGWQDILEIPVTLATFDRELWLAAKNTNMPVWPEALPVSRG